MFPYSQSMLEHPEGSHWPKQRDMRQKHTHCNTEALDEEQTYDGHMYTMHPAINVQDSGSRKFGLDSSQVVLPIENTPLPHPKTDPRHATPNLKSVQ